MQNIRYHFINIIAVTCFSYILAVTINQFFRFNFVPTEIKTSSYKSAQEIKTTKTFEDYKSILDSNFFKIASDKPQTDGKENAVASANLQEILLLGTISGPSSIARALIRKKSDKESQIFKLWSDVFGYKLIRIDNSRVYLKAGDQIDILDMYPKEEQPVDGKKATVTTSAGAVKSTQSISRSEIQQKVLNNIDNALQGVRAGPHRGPDGNIEGYKLFRVSPDNILYKLGARTGDIVKRINGHPIDSTEKLMGLWQSVQGESKISIDLERNGQLHSYDLNITN